MPGPSSTSENGGSSSETILSYGDSLLRQSDLQLLTHSRSSWLNDTLIGFYFEYLSKEVFPLDDKAKSRLKFFSPQVTQCIKLNDPVEIFIDTSDGELNSFNCLLWPLNNSNDTDAYSSGSHWSLLVYSKKDNSVYHADSSPGLNAFAAEILYGKLKPVLPNGSTLKSLPCPSQINGYDCGLHVLINAQLIGEYILHGSETLNETKLLEKATPSKAEHMRTRLVELIQTKSRK